MRELSNTEQSFLESLLRGLCEARVVCIILRNYEGLPNLIGNDLDLFIDASDRTCASNVLLQKVLEYGGKVSHIHCRSYFYAFWIIFPSSSLALHIDLYPGAFTWHGIHYLTPGQLVRSSVRHARFSVPRPAHEALSLLFTSLLWGSFLKTRYIDRIRFLLQDRAERSEFSTIVHQEFGHQVSAKIANFLDESIPFDAGNVARSARNQLRFRKLLFNLPQWLNYWFHELSLLFTPPGLHIVFLGPDGSGKSAVNSEVSKKIGPFFGAFKSHHWRPQVLEDVGVIVKTRAKSREPNQNPHSAPLHGLIPSLLRFLYYMTDYLLSIPTLMKQKAQNQLIVFDRYAYDMAIDPKRYRFHLPPWLLKTLVRLAPLPDLVFCLDAPVDVLQSRKQEVSREETARQRVAYRSFVHSLPNGHIIDASLPLEQVAEAVAAIIQDFLARRAEKTVRNILLREQPK